MSRRVVITGLGPITGFGIGIDPLWEAMRSGKSAIARIDRFAKAEFPCVFAAELDREIFSVKKVVPKHYRKATKVMCRDIELAVAAADAAVRDAGLVTRGIDADAEPTINPDRMGCQIGAGLIAAEIDELTAALVTSRSADNGREFDLSHWGHTGMTNLTPLWLLKYLPNMLACHVTIIHDCQGPSNTITCCEASSALSLGESVRVIDRGDADACLTGGAEHRLNPLTFFRQHFADRLAVGDPDQDPSTVVRPFDPDARGTVVGEGGGILVVEALESAKSRDVHVYAEIAGFASTQSWCDDSLGLRPNEDDESIVDVMEAALTSAKTSAAEVDAIVPFGSSMPHIDRAEANAIQRVFGDRTSEIPLITTVPVTGNCGAGNGAVALSAGCQALNTQTLPARLNTCGAQGLDANASPSRAADLRTILVSTTSQGGQNAAIVLKRLDS